MTAPSYTVTVTSQLSQDFVTSDQVVVDGGATNQVAVFRNAAKGAAVEALVIPETGAGAALSYLCQTSASTTGWDLKTLTDVGGNSIVASEVVALSTTWGSVVAFYVGADGGLYRLDLVDGQWGAPSAVSGVPANLVHLRVCYSPGATASSGDVAVYGVSGGKILGLCLGRGGAFTGLQANLNVAMGSWNLAFTDTSGGLLLTAVQSADDAQGLFYSWTGSVSPSRLSFPPMPLALSGKPTGKALFMATSMSGSTDKMLLQLCNVNVAGTLKRRLSWALNPDSPKLASGGLPGAYFEDAAVVQTTDGFVHVYGIDAEMNLQVVHQQAYDASQMKSGFSAGQTWGPLLTVNSGIRAVYADPMPSDAPALMAVDGALGGLHLHTMDPKTKLWLSLPIHLPTQTRYELTRWRTKATVYDANGQPASGVDLAVGADSVVEVQANGAYTVIDSTTTATVTTDARGQATVAALATNITTPTLSFATSDQSLGAHAPGGYINDWFAGSGQIPGLDDFSGGLLSSAQVDGRPLAPGLGSDQAPSAEDAADLISQMASIMATQDTSAPQSFAARPSEVHVYSTLRGSPRRAVYADMAGYRAAREADGPVAFGVVDTISDVWDDVWDFAGDVWDSIESGFMQLAEVAVDVARGVVQIVVWVGDKLVQLADWVIQTVEDALQAIVSVFKWIGALIEDLVAFLKTLFDLGAIWNTKDAFYEVLLALPEAGQVLVDQASTWLQDNALASVKTELGGFFDQALAFMGDSTFSGLDGWNHMGAPDASVPVAGGATEDAMTNDPGANWFMDQLDQAGDFDLGIQGVTDNESVQNLLSAIGDVAEDLVQIATDFGAGLTALVDADSIASFAEVAVATVLVLVRDFVFALLDLLDVVIQAFLAVASLGLEAFVAALSTPLDIPIVSSLYSWLAELAGHPDDRLSVGNLLAMIAAFPVTIVYKLVAGADSEPFPGGTFPGLGELTGPVSFAATTGGGGGNRSLGIVGGALTCLNTVFMVWKDVRLGKTNKWVKLAGAVVTGLDLFVSSAASIGLGWFQAILTGAITVFGGGVGFAAVLGLLGWVGAVTTDMIYKLTPANILAFVASDLFAVILSCVGGVVLVVRVVAIISGGLKGLTAVSGIVEGLPVATSFVATTTFRAIPYIGKPGWVLKIALDFCCDLSGGIVEIVDYST